jgi:hypothetical protein
MSPLWASRKTRPNELPDEGAQTGRSEDGAEEPADRPRFPAAGTRIEQVSAAILIGTSNSSAATGVLAISLQAPGPALVVRSAHFEAGVADGEMRVRQRKQETRPAGLPGCRKCSQAGAVAGRVTPLLVEFAAERGRRSL